MIESFLIYLVNKTIDIVLLDDDASSNVFSSGFYTSTGYNQ